MQNITLLGASYTDVPAVTLPKTGGGTAQFDDTTDANATAADIASGKTAYVNGVKLTGTGSSGGGGTPAGIIANGGTFTVASSYSGTQTIPHGLGKKPFAMCIYPITSKNNDSGTYAAVGGFFSYATVDKANILPTTITVQNPDSQITNIAGFGLYLKTNENALTPRQEWVGSFGSLYFQEPDSTNIYYSMPSSDGVILGGVTYGWWATAEDDNGGGGGGATLITKSITANGTYDAEDDNADGYSSVTVNVSGGTTKNVQTTQSTSRRNNTALGSITSLTCSKAGTYDVYWTCSRSNTSQTWGSQLYLGGTAYGTENTTWSNHVQNNHLENVSISANQTVAVYGRSRSGYYIYAPQLTIVEK